MKVCVIKLQGAGLIEKQSSCHVIDWLSYRDFAINTEYFEAILKFISNNPDWKFVFTSGGVGAFLYQRLAENLNLPDHFVCQLGIDIVNIVNRIFLLYLYESGVNVCEEVVTVEKIDRKNFDLYDCLFLSPSQGFMSSDSLAAAAAKKLSSDLLIFFKKDAPVYHVGFDFPTQVLSWDVHDMLRRAVDFEMAGNGRYIIDFMALDTIRDGKLDSVIVSPQLTSTLTLDQINVFRGKITNIEV